MVCFSNGNKADSLLIVYESGANEDKISALLNLSKIYKYDSVELAKEYAYEALVLAEKIKNDTLIVNSIGFLGPILLLQNDYNTILELYNQAIVISKREKYDKGLGSTYNQLASYYYAKNNLDSAIYFYKQSIVVNRKRNDLVWLAKTYNNVGIMFYRKAQKDSSLYYFIKSLEIKEQVLPSGKRVASDNELAASLINVGLFYYNLKEYIKAINYLQRAEKISEKANNTNYKAIAKVNLGILFNTVSKFDSAEYYHLSAINLCEKMNNVKLLSQAYTGLGNVYKNTNAFEKAIEYFSLSHNLHSKLNDIRGQAIVEKSLSELYLKNSNYQNAEKYGLLALKSALESKNIEVQKEMYLILAELNELTKRFENAFYYQKEYIEIKDSLDIANNEQLILDMQTKYETEKKDFEIQKLKIANFEIESSRKIIRIIAISIGLVAILLLILFWQRIRTNLLLKDKNQQLKNLNATQSKLTSIISHDLKSPLSAFYSITSSLKSKFNKMETGDIELHFDRMLNSAVALKLQLENMLNWAINQTNQTSVNKQHVNLSVLAYKVIVILQEFANEKAISILNNINDNIELKTDAKLLNIVLNNMIANAVKFSTPNSKVVVSEFRENGEVIISIKDTGVGMNKHAVLVLNNSNEIMNNENTDTGLGFVISKDIVRKLGGELWVESVEGEGTEVFIKI